MRILLKKDSTCTKTIIAVDVSVVTIKTEDNFEGIKETSITFKHHINSLNSELPLLVNTFENSFFKEDDYILISQINLSVICSVIAILRSYSIEESIKNGVNYIECHGQHHLFDSEISEEARKFILSYIGYTNKNEIPVDVEDVTEYILNLIDNFQTEDNYKIGKVFIENRILEADESIVSGIGNVVVLMQNAESDTVGLDSEYIMRDKEFDYIILFNEKSKSISISSREGKNEIRNMVELLRVVLCSEASGHKSFAKTPKGEEYTLVDAERLLQVVSLLQGAWTL